MMNDFLLRFFDGWKYLTLFNQKKKKTYKDKIIFQKFYNYNSPCDYGDDDYFI